ncbi:hypothetical protein [Erythrobacter litoralis]|uniref:Uncharacterized protein n=1 Tax=Erythrobacter litoralis (strain HTCC2594) TaxID=314225 RepID=Q2NCA5_ERYLH|nr:hypothetical protein [Erythrobacter litoralis]ABC62686.1 hypothetical protein ELI_02970 [Erythrobacter litoralis HTCC2594]
MSKHPDPHSFDPAGDTAGDASPNLSSLELTPAHAKGWTPRRQAVFLRELAATHNVSAAARAVGMSRQSAYRVRARLQGQPFDLAWQAAFRTRFDALAEKALQLAMEGTEVPHFHQGELIHTSRRHDTRLMLGLLALKDRLRRSPPSSREPAFAYDGDDLGELIARVEEGPERWRDGLDEEYAAKRERAPREGEEENEFLLEVVDYEEEFGSGGEP